MSLISGLQGIKKVPIRPCFASFDISRAIHTTVVCEKSVQSARYKKFPPGMKPRFTYEMTNQPHNIAVRKSWLSWNTSTLLGGRRSQLTTLEDMFIRKFIYGVMHGVFDSELIIKRQHNLIRVAGVITEKYIPRKIYFMIGFTEEMLSNWLQCPVKLEIQTCSTGVI